MSKRLVGITMTTPDDLGPAIADYRALLGLSRGQLACIVADATGDSRSSVAARLWDWEVGKVRANTGSLGPILNALGCDLALIPREDS